MDANYNVNGNAASNGGKGGDASNFGGGQIVNGTYVDTYHNWTN